MNDAGGDAGVAAATTADRLLAERRRRRGGHLAIVVVLIALVGWSVDVTIVKDTDWERIGSFANVLEAGGNGFQVLLYAILPQVLPQVLGVIVFEWEINIRRSAILGLVGAGGLGLVFFRQMNTFNFPGVTTVILAILGIILIGEVVSHFARKAVI